MKETRIIMGMPVIVEVVDDTANQETLEKVFEYFVHVDEKFSTYKSTSEICAINRGEIKVEESSDEMKEVFRLSEETKQLTKGYFDIKKPDGSYETSGLVKGWAIHNAAKILSSIGMKNFCINVGGDIEVSGHNDLGGVWKVGIQNPFNKKQEIIKVVNLSNGGIATSGTYVRGDHIYGTNNNDEVMKEIVSMTIIGPNIYEADRFATAAFAMGREGISFVENLEGFEGYMIDNKGIATMTSGFEQYI